MVHVVNIKLELVPFKALGVSVRGLCRGAWTLRM